MLIGYARVSTNDQTLALQQDALTNAGCERIFTDTASGSIADRQGLEEAISQLRPGDALVVWRLDRLGRSLRHLVETITALHVKGIGFKSLTEQIDTTTSGGKLIFHIFGALAEFERDIIRERTQAGLAAARARGRQGGRPKLPNTARKVAWAKKLYEDQQIPVKDICRDLNISRQPCIGTCEEDRRSHALGRIVPRSGRNRGKPLSQ
jgi:DNA invertase Pin-like site-specific DNA recombinase